MNNRKNRTGGLFGKRREYGVHQLTVAEKGGVSGWNKAGVELYKVLRDCF